MEAQVQNGRAEAVGENYRGAGVRDELRLNHGDIVMRHGFLGAYTFTGYLEHCENRWSWVRDHCGKLLCVMSMDLKPFNPGRQDEGVAQ
jgi:hypothetical protein